MKEYIEKIKDWFNDLPTWAKIGVIVAIPLLLIFFFSKPSKNMMSADEYSTRVSAAGNGGSSGGGSGISDGSFDFDGIGYENTDRILEQNQNLSNRINDVLDSYSNYRSESENMIRAANLTAQTAQNEAALLGFAARANIYYDSAQDSNQFNQIFNSIQSAVMGGEVSESAGKAAIQSIAGLGNDGVMRAGQSTYDPLPTTQNEILSEIARTQAVMENRQAAGLSTELQEKYLDTITKK